MHARNLLLAALCGASLVLSLPATAQAPADDPSVDDMVRSLQPPPRSRSIAGAGPQQGGQLRLSVQFDFASARISPASAALLERLAQAMRNDTLTTFAFRVEGHTDSIGSAESNQRLSERRAESVRQFLVARGIDAARLQAVGKGSNEPQDAKDTTAAVNRRVVIAAVPAASLAAARPESITSSTLAVPAGDAGQVRQMQGTASVLRNQVTQPLQVADVVRQGDTIHIDPASHVLIVLGDGGRLLLRPNTSVTLTAMVHNGPLGKLEHAIDLVGGALRYVTGDVGKRRPQAVRFKTPTITMGIRGTDVEIVYTPRTRGVADAGTYVKVNSGAVELNGVDGTQLALQKDEQAFAGANDTRTRGGPPPTRKLTAPAGVFGNSELDGLLEKP